MKLGVRRVGVLAQLLLLIGVTLSAGGLINYAMIVSRPPPEFPVYRISEIANAFRGQPVRLEGRGQLALSWDGAAGAAGAIRAAQARAEGSPEGREPLRRDASLGAALAAVMEVPADSIDFYVGTPPGGRRHLLHELMRQGMNVDGERLVIGRFLVVFHADNGGVAVLRPDLRYRSHSAWARQIALVVLAGLLIMLPVALLFAQRLTRPIRVFAASAERVGRDPFGEPVPVRGPAEIAAAAEALNLMQSRLRAFVSERLRIVAAVAHDLRTPLTRLSFLAEKAPPELRDSMRAEIREMSSMMDATMAFVRDATRPVTRERIELRSLLETIADEASDHGEDVDLEPGPGSRDPGRRGGAEADDRQSGDQRPEVRRRRGPAAVARGSGGADRGRRPRPRAARERTRAGVRALLPQRTLALAGNRRGGPGPLGRSRHRPRARRRGLAGEP